MNSAPRVLMLYRADDRFADDPFTRIAPYGLFTIHGYLRAHGIDSQLHNLTGVPLTEIDELLRATRPDVIGVSHFTFNHGASQELYRAADRVVPQALKVAGGPQASHLDELVLRRAPGPDLIVRGEGEGAMLELCRAWQGPNGPLPRGPNLSWLEAGELHRTDEAIPPKEIDSFHTAHRFEAVHRVRIEEQFPIVITSRGCPAQCTFCNTPFYWGRAMRFRSAENVVDEIELVARRFGIAYFSLRDDTFTASKGRVGEICEALERRRLSILWNCQSRVNLIDEERLLWMKKAGCDQMQFGVESASEQILGELAKKIRIDQIDRALTTCRRVGIKTSAYFIMGVPGQTDRDLQQNLAIFGRTGLMGGVVSALAYYPGTALYDKAHQRGEVGPEIFFTGEVDDLFVRHDPEARRLYQEMERGASERGERNRWTLEELEAQLALTDRCYSALLDYGALLDEEGRVEEAREAYREVERRWPESPWGALALRHLEQRQAGRSGPKARRAARRSRLSM